MQIGGHHIPLERVLEQATDEGAMIGKDWEKWAEENATALATMGIGSTNPHSLWAHKQERWYGPEGMKSPQAMLVGYWASKNLEFAKGLYSSQAWSLFGSVQPTKPP